ncbi:hypothetical protein LCI18_014859 [Fusarium solani-melongenae]|uniref:Uncharacterized protein n=1 Tax=Fusarium solani subsp. cucurbitae TaxID=2747967 RepID=A0ACD3ZRJ4_FUSSC|nr:hypothetical protein LCI18_014859 [Fusarium solani-melongenae]
MGGKAFTNHNPPLQTPRMPGSVYHEVKRRVEHRLSKAFSVVRFPIEGPAKQDFGDIDVFVAGPRFQSQEDEYTRREYLDHISAVLGATAVIEDTGVQEPSAHFAIPWPRDLEHLPDSPNPQEPTYAIAGPSSRPDASAQIDTPAPRSFSTQIDTSPYPNFFTQVSASTRPGASAPAVRSPHGSVPTPSNASPYATPSTPVTATTPTLPSFPAVPSAYSKAVTPTEFPLPRSRFDGTHAKPNQRPDWPRSTELEMTLPDREFRHISGAQQRGGRSRSLPPVRQDPEQFAPRQSRRSRSGSARPYSRRGPSRWEEPPNENSNSQEESVSAPFSRRSLAPDLPSSRPITPPRERRLHIQVDVQVFDSSSRLHYMLFHHAHGDIWQLLGNVIKPYGLTVDDKGLWLRIPEIEDADRKRSKVWLTGDPDEILDFLGLPCTRYWAGPFRDLYQMYEYVANCVTFWVPSGSDTNTALRANDRRRMKQRPAYRKWVEEFKPLCRAQGRFSDEPMTRDQVRGRAFARFNVRQTYMTERRAFLVEDQKRHILKTIIERIVPLPAEDAVKEDFLYRTVLVRALKEIVLDWNRGLYSIMAPGNLRDDEGFYHLGRTESFVLEYKDRIGKEAMDLHNQRMKDKRAHEQPSRD